MKICPVSLREANDFVAQYHRHHKPIQGHKFSIGLRNEDSLIGVAIVGSPVARLLDNGETLEVNRCCTDGTKNACSMLYRAAWKAASAMGYERLITYTLPSEGGASLRGAGFKLLGLRGGGGWNRPNRFREDKAPTCQKHLWELLCV